MVLAFRSTGSQDYGTVNFTCFRSPALTYYFCSQYQRTISIKVYEQRQELAQPMQRQRVKTTVPVNNYVKIRAVRGRTTVVPIVLPPFPQLVHRVILSATDRAMLESWWNQGHQEFAQAPSWHGPRYYCPGLSDLGLLCVYACRCGAHGNSWRNTINSIDEANAVLPA